MGVRGVFPDITGVGANKDTVPKLRTLPWHRHVIQVRTEGYRLEMYLSILSPTTVALAAAYVFIFKTQHCFTKHSSAFISGTETICCFMYVECTFF